MEHFKQHRIDNPAITFVDFIKMHYIGPYIVTDDFTQDEQLPFRGAEYHMMTSHCECQICSVDIEVPIPPSPEFYSYNELNQPQISTFDIFQPPRVA